MSMFTKGDVFNVVVPFNGLQGGSLGVCISMRPGKNLVWKADILMENGSIATLTERETYLFLRSKGKMNVEEMPTEELINQLKHFNQPTA